MLTSQKKFIICLILGFTILLLNKDNVVQGVSQQLGNLPPGSIVKDVEGFSEHWIVLGSGHFDDDSSLLLLERTIPGGARAVHSGPTNIWEITNLRQYLRSDFYQSLSSNFKSHINKVTTVTAGMELTNETVFLLSANEFGFNISFGSDHGSKIGGIETYLTLGESYWTRSPYLTGPTNNRFVIVSKDGKIMNAENKASSNVRPAVHLSPDTAVYGPYTSKGKTYYTLFDIEKRTVTFDSNGGNTVSPITIEHGKTLNEPNTPIRTGYTFSSWYTDQNLTNEFDFNHPITEDMTLYAEWIGNKYTVTFNAGDGVVDPKTQEKIFDSEYGSEVELPIPTREGYTFTGWNIEEDGTGDEIMDNSKVNIASDHTLYAQWEINEYTVTFEDYNGTELKIVKVNHGEAATAPDAPNRTGYTFTGWDNNFDNVTKDLTVTAQYDINQYTVSFQSNGGSSVNSITTDYNTTIKKPTSPSRLGYTFEGWYTDENLTDSFDFNNPITEDMTLYANWEANKYTVTFDARDGNVTPKTQEKTFSSQYGSEDALPVPMKEGYTFIGWNTKENGTGDSITNETIVKTATNHKLYAQWEINEYTVTFEDYNGTELKIVKVNHGEATTAPDNPNRIGYTFSGWDNNFDNVTKDLTVTAQYKINQYTVSLQSNGGSNVDSITTDYNTTIKKPTSPTRPGYTFEGWYTDENLTNFFDFSNPITKDITLYAKWSDIIPPSINLTVSTTEPTNQDVTITATITDTGSGVAEAKWAVDNQNITYFENDGTVFSSDSKDYTFKISENGTYTVYAKDAAGNETVETIKIENIDKVPPVITIDSYTTEPTNEDIVVKATTDKGNLNETSYTFTANGEFEFVATDEAGNKTKKTVTITNIDKTAPVINLIASTMKPTNQDITITATITDTGSGVAEAKWAVDNQNVTYFENDGTVFSSDSKDYTFKISENGTYTVYAKDAAGNETVKTFEVENIDKVPPVITIDNYTTKPTNHDIVVTASTDKGTLNKTSHTFTTNGEFEFIATDEAGNETKKTVTIRNIDKTAPEVNFDPDGNDNKSSKATTIVTVSDNLSGVKASNLRYIWTNKDDERPDDNDEGWIEFTNGDTLSLNRKNGDWYLHIVASDNVGNEGYKVSKPFNLFYNPPSPPSQPDNNDPQTPTETRNAKIIPGNDENEQNIVETAITRKTENNHVIDEVSFTETEADEIVDKAVNNNSDTVKIIVDDIPDELADEVQINVATDTVNKLNQANLNLTIETSDVQITIPQTSLEQLTASGEDLYFRIVPIREREQRQTIEERVIRSEEIQQYTAGQTVQVIGRPMTIETNYANQRTLVTFSLTDIDFPTDELERDGFLNNLAMYIEHSDGENVIKHGKINYDIDGNATSIEIEIDKFSTFSFIQVEKEIEIIDFPSYIQGYQDKTFGPSKTLTRAHLAAILSRNLDIAIPIDDMTPYPDVKPTHWAYEHILKMRALEIMNGYESGYFGPEHKITRAQLAAVTTRWKNLEDIKTNAFTDIDNHWAAGAIGAAKRAGIIDGYPDGTFRPNDAVTRAQAVKMINITLHRPAFDDVKKSIWSDVAADHWALRYIESASTDFQIHQFNDGTFEIIK